MGTGQKSELAGELRKSLEKESDHALLFAAALVVVHLLNIAPTEVSALGAKVVLSSPIILRGVISILLLHKIHLLVVNMRYAYAYGDLKEGERQLVRHTLQRHTKNGRSSKTKKRWSRLELGVWGLLFAPYAMTLLLFLIVAVSLSVGDLITFAVYCFDKAPAMQQLKVYVDGR